MFCEECSGMWTGGREVGNRRKLCGRLKWQQPRSNAAILEGYLLQAIFDSRFVQTPAFSTSCHRHFGLSQWPPVPGRNNLHSRTAASREHGSRAFTIAQRSCGCTLTKYVLIASKLYFHHTMEYLFERHIICM